MSSPHLFISHITGAESGLSVTRTNIKLLLRDETLMIPRLPWGHLAGAAANKHEKQRKLNTNYLGQKGEIAVSIRTLVK